MTTQSEGRDVNVPALFPSSAAVVGFFDSGVGGTTVLREVRSRLPGHPLLYLADQARCPYGPRDEATLRRFACDDTRWLLAHGAELVVVACNTASAAALHWLRQTFPQIPFVGMVPALKPAARSTASRVVGVLATPATMQGQLLREVMRRWTEGITVVEQVAPGLVELIEAGQLSDAATRTLLWQYLEPIVAAGADHVVLGCTHYPYLIPLIRQLAPSLQIVDAAPAVARQVARVLQMQALTDPTTCDDYIVEAPIQYATTGPLAPFQRLLSSLDVPPGDVIQACGHPATRRII